MSRYAYLDSEVEEVSFGGRVLSSCKICSEQPADKLCNWIRWTSHCCLGTSTTCKQNNCPNNQK